MNNYAEACRIAKEADKKYLAHDFHPSQIVVLHHGDGAVLNYISAQLREWRGWIFVFTEHHGTHVYHKTDLTFYAQYTQKEIEKLEGTGFTDKCMFCGKENKVEYMVYGGNYDDVWQILCENCNTYKYSDQRELWAELNAKNEYNFIWGKPNVYNLEKAVELIIDKDKMLAMDWLNTPSQAFPESPMKLLDDDDYDPIYTMIFQTITGNYIS
jgi:transcription elongation factor Elf1